MRLMHFFLFAVIPVPHSPTPAYEARVGNFPLRHRHHSVRLHPALERRRLNPFQRMVVGSTVINHGAASIGAPHLSPNCPRHDAEFKPIAAMEAGADIVQCDRVDVWVNLLKERGWRE